MLETILVVSDNHGSLESIRQLINQKKYFAVLHAGDFTCDPQSVLKLHPKTYFILGNNDSYDQGSYLPKDGQYYPQDNVYLINLLGQKILLTHGHYVLHWEEVKSRNNLKQLAEKYGANFLIFGHTHVPYYQTLENLHLLNPGSINYPRSNSGRTYGEIEIKNNQILNVTVKHLA
ncbi:putative phosphoesterase [Mycoplasmoides fastidiosum]|uniref:Phosphoesterase n=1 Tax=Mycoplasmoides fastidiosum TaxID=92758 RepID=A0ABU0LYS4_9BACT|nr:metallophosphoesterase [Mycoplasmoides fastidiosum]MDQ0513863.1 putative phosphoesterase [Mycoplasmoides fastidiosum]UUD37723.1 metallophosphoesterase [Mycoplasmoides fastidiosum]